MIGLIEKLEKLGFMLHHQLSVDLILQSLPPSFSNFVMNFNLWHCRLGHINEKRINKLYKNGYLRSFDYESFDICEFCLLRKMTKTPFTGKGERSTELLSLIHTDVCGPMSTQARNGFSYFLTFTDDHSRYGHVYLLKYKSEVFEKFKEYKSEVENQLGKVLKSFEQIEVVNT